MVEKTNSKTVENKELISSIIYLKSKGLIKKINSKIKFETVSGAENSSKEDIVSILLECLNGIKQDISELLVAGYSLKLEGIKLLRVPLKIKIWESTLARKDLEIIFQILDNVNLVVLSKKESHEKIISKNELTEKNIIGRENKNKQC